MIHTSGKVAQEPDSGGRIMAMNITSDTVEIFLHYKSNCTSASPPNKGGSSWHDCEIPA
jgi:hypothetical protein